MDNIKNMNKQNAIYLGAAAVALAAIYYFSKKKPSIAATSIEVNSSPLAIDSVDAPPKRGKYSFNSDLDRDVLINPNPPLYDGMGRKIDYTMGGIPPMLIPIPPYKIFYHFKKGDVVYVYDMKMSDKEDWVASLGGVNIPFSMLSKVPESSELSSITKTTNTGSELIKFKEPAFDR